MDYIISCVFRICKIEIKIAHWADPFSHLFFFFSSYNVPKHGGTMVMRAMPRKCYDHRNTAVLVDLWIKADRAKQPQRTHGI